FQPESEEILKNYIERLTELIPTGRNNAIPMKDVATLLNISERAVRVLVQKAREHGAPICSDWENRGGYFYPADTYEAMEYFRQQKSRIKTARAALNGITQYLNTKGAFHG
ncbi:MAG: hypothetical protein ACI4JS_10790, partial [Oscillospiraceae bacterium]